MSKSNPRAAKRVAGKIMCVAPQTNTNPMPKPRSGPMNCTSAYMTRKRTNAPTA